MKGVTTIEQSKRLTDAGFDPFTADMYYAHPNDYSGEKIGAALLYNGPYCRADVAPAWSLGRLWMMAARKGIRFCFDDTDGVDAVVDNLITLILLHNAVH